MNVFRKLLNFVCNANFFFFCDLIMTIELILSSLLFGGLEETPSPGFSRLVLIHLCQLKQRHIVFC